jgi:hypothetical protein
MDTLLYRIYTIPLPGPTIHEFKTTQKGGKGEGDLHEKNEIVDVASHGASNTGNGIPPRCKRYPVTTTLRGGAKVQLCPLVGNRPLTVFKE